MGAQRNFVFHSDHVMIPRQRYMSGTTTVKNRVAAAVGGMKLS